MLTHTLLPKLRQLRWSGMVDSLEERAELAREQKLSPTEFLALLVDDELERRSQTKQVKMEKAACFENTKLLSHFDFNAVPTLDRSLVREMATCQLIAQHANWLVCGPTGVGKTHLATAIGYEAIKRSYSVYNSSVHKLQQEMFAARADDAYTRLIKKLVNVDLLILDDFGLRPITIQGAEDLYEIIHQRYEKGSIVLTSNRAPSEWPEMFGDSLLASAAMDRLTHHARVTVVTGESYRQRQRRGEVSKPDNASVE